MKSRKRKELLRKIIREIMALCVRYQRPPYDIHNIRSYFLYMDAKRSWEMLHNNKNYEDNYKKKVINKRHSL